MTQRPAGDDEVATASVACVDPIPDRALGCEAMAMRRRVVALPLFWRVFAANASVLMLAFCGLVFAPVTVSVPVGAGELAILATGLVALLAANVVFLRPAFA